MKTSDKLKTLFDYQEFVKDSDLVCMKVDAEKASHVLTDDELAMVNGGLPSGVNSIPIVLSQAILLGVMVDVNMPTGAARGRIIDAKGSEVLIDSVGWVDVKDTDLCQ